MSEPFEMIAKTLQGLEEVLAKELTALGANDIEIGRRMVAFTGDKEMMYRANFCLRTAIRILKPIKHFEANNADEVYEQVKAIAWEEYLGPDSTFAVDSVVFSETFRHSKFVSYRVKDAIVDRFRELTGRRPGVRVNHPDILLNIHIAETHCTLSLDSSGESLHRRGYRQEAVEAPLSEVLAAGLILLTGWHGECDLIDPMAGSGTIPIEAALIARNVAPGVYRKGYAFERWPDFDQELFDAIYNDDSQEREFEHKIYAYDNSTKAVEIATNNIKAAGMSRDIVLRLQPMQQFQQPAEGAIIITNPPYGERISTDDLLGLYETIGERLKHAFTGGTAWILSYREECFDQIGLKASKRIPLNNGALECEFRQYEIFEGKYRDFRAEGEELSRDPRQSSLRERQSGWRGGTNNRFGSGRQDRYNDRQDRFSNRQERRYNDHYTDRYGNRSDDRYTDRQWRSYDHQEGGEDDSRPSYRRYDRQEARNQGGYRRDYGDENGNYRRSHDNDEGGWHRRSYDADYRRQRSGESYPERKRREREEGGQADND